VLPLERTLGLDTAIDRLAAEEAPARGSLVVAIDERGVTVWGSIDGDGPVLYVIARRVERVDVAEATATLHVRLAEPGGGAVEAGAVELPLRVRSRETRRAVWQRATEILSGFPQS
jgi:hypothetical protein